MSYLFEHMQVFQKDWPLHGNTFLCHLLIWWVILYEGCNHRIIIIILDILNDFWKLLFYYSWTWNFSSSINIWIFRKYSFYGELYRKVKRKLLSGHRHDPDIRIKDNMDPDVFGLGLVKACLGLKWNKRISKGNGEFAYVINGTVKYSLTKGSLIVEYK